MAIPWVKPRCGIFKFIQILHLLFTNFKQKIKILYLQEMLSSVVVPYMGWCKSETTTLVNQ